MAHSLHACSGQISEYDEKKFLIMVEESALAK
jgi:hypothetical protein